MKSVAGCSIAESESALSRFFHAEKDKTTYPGKGDRGVEKMKISDRYTKIVEWSEVDQCYVGTCPELFYGGCHGDSEAGVYRELCEIVEENIALYKEDGKPLPPGIIAGEYRAFDPPLDFPIGHYWKSGGAGPYMADL